MSDRWSDLRPPTKFLVLHADHPHLDAGRRLRHPGTRTGAKCSVRPWPSVSTRTCVVDPTRPSRNRATAASPAARRRAARSFRTGFRHRGHPRGGGTRALGIGEDMQPGQTALPPPRARCSRTSPRSRSGTRQSGRRRHDVRAKRAGRAGRDRWRRSEDGGASCASAPCRPPAWRRDPGEGCGISPRLLGDQAPQVVVDLHRIERGEP